MAENGGLHIDAFLRLFGGREIRNIIINRPATIILWEDGDKTVVKCRECDEFDPVVGVLLCVAKRFFGDEYTAFKKKLFAVADSSDARTLDQEHEYLCERTRKFAEKAGRSIHINANRYSNNRYGGYASVFYNETDRNAGDLLQKSFKEARGMISEAEKLERVQKGDGEC